MTAQEQFAILSWNVHGLGWPLTSDLRGRLDRIGAKIRERSPEIVLLQEVWSASEIPQLNAILRPEWTSAFAPRRGGSAMGGLVVFVKRSAGWNLCDFSQFALFKSSAPVWKIWEGDGFAGKGALIFEVERKDFRLRCINAHLQSQYSGSDYFAVRRDQLLQLGEIVSGSQQPTVVAGDLNTAADEPLYAQIAALGADLTRSAREKVGGGTNMNADGSPPQWIDYILAASFENWSLSADLELITNTRVDHPYSDHSGLLCTVRATRRSP